MLPTDDGTGTEPPTESTQSDQTAQTAEAAATTAEQAMQAVQSARSGDAASAATASSGVTSSAVAMTGNSDATRAASTVQTAATVARSVVDAVQSIAAQMSRDDSGAPSGGSGGSSGGGRPLAHALFTFECDQAHAHWRVLRFEADEAISEPYEYLIDLAADEAQADADELLGHTCTFHIDRGEQHRAVHGVVRRVEHLGTRGEHFIARAHVVPAVWALSQRINCRIFQNQTVPDIVATILDEGLAPYSRQHRASLQRQYNPREYCVQYNESDLAFVMRLLAEEGIGFFFEQGSDGETIVLFDLNEALPLYQSADGSPVSVLGDASHHAEVESIRTLDWHREMRTTSVVTRDFDFTRPALDITRPSRAQDLRQRDRERFVYPGANITNYDDGAHNYTREDGRLQADLHRQREALLEHTGVVHSNVTGFHAGLSFEVAGHARDDRNQQYVITRVRHRGTAPEELLADVRHHHRDDHAERYANEITVAPADTPFVPPRIAKPHMRGPQTATVVGPASEEIHTDAHGRIRAQFHWDREGQNDEHSSCWIRVKQSWSGPGWGTIFLPRIGMEVVVDFLDGDPDRPIVTGSVYNGTHPPPYQLPDHKTRSTIRTRSSPNSEGFNEIRFEDAANNEEIFLHAQRDLNETVLHNHSTTVSSDQTNTVQGKQTEHVHKDQQLTVDQNRTTTVQQDETTTVHGNRTETVDHDERVTIHGARTERVDGRESIGIGGAQAIGVGGGQSVVIGGDLDGGSLPRGIRRVSIAAGDQLEVRGNKEDHVTRRYAITADQKFVLVQGNTQMIFQSNEVLIQAAGSVRVEHGSGSVTIDDKGNVKAQSGGRVELEASGCAVRLHDGNVEISASNQISITGPGGSVRIDSAGATVSGNSATLSADGQVQVQGSIVKVN